MALLAQGIEAGSDGAEIIGAGGGTEAARNFLLHLWYAPQRLRFVIDFAYATGLRASELVGARLGMIEEDAKSEHWLRVVGKGSKVGSVALPPMARSALDRYLAGC